MTGFFYGWIIVIAAACSTMTFSVFTSYTTFFKPLMLEFGWARTATSAVYSSFTIVYSLTSILTGWLVDRYSPRKIIFLGGCLLSVGCFLSSQIRNYMDLVICYGVVAALGSGALWVPPLSITQRWFVKRRTIAAALAQAGSNIGLIYTPALANYFIYHYHWRTTFMFFALFLFTVITIVSIVIKGKPEEMGLRPDGETEETDIAHIVSGTRLVESLRIKEVLGTKAYWLLFFLYFSSLIGLHTMYVHLVPYAVDIGLTPTDGATALSILGICAIISRLTVGYLGDRLRKIRLLSLLFFTQVLALIILIKSENIFMLYSSTALIGIGSSGCVPLFPPILSEYFGLTHLGALYGVFTLAFGFSGIIGPIFSGYTYDLLGSYFGAFLLLITIALVGVLITFIIKPQKKKLENM